MRPTHRALAAATVATGAGVGLLALGQPGAGLALATAGLGTGLLVTERSTPAERAREAAHGSVVGLALLTRALALEGRAIMVPPGPGMPEPRCFLPAKAVLPEEIPPLDAATVIHRAPPGVLGLALPPTGIGLVQAWGATEALPGGGGIEAATLHLRRALPGLGVGTHVRVERAGTQARVRFRHALFEELCTWTRTEGAPWHLQGMCPACSMVHTLVALGMARPVLVREAEGTGAEVTLTLEVGPSSPA